MEMSIEPEVDKIGTCLQQASLKYFPVIFAIRLLIMVLIRRNTLYPKRGTPSRTSKSVIGRTPDDQECDLTQTRRLNV